MLRQQQIPLWLHLGAFLVRIGLGVTFFWTGNDLVTPPLSVAKLEDRLGDLAQIGLVTPSTIIQVVQLIGHMEVAAGLFLIIGLFTRPAAVGLAALLALYLVRTGAGSLFAVKDAGLLGAALALALNGSGFLSLDAMLAGWGPVKRLAAPAPSWLARFGPLFLRLGLAVVFLWSGVNMLTHLDASAQEMAKAQVIPDWPLLNRIDVVAQAYWLGVGQIVFAAMLLFGLLTKPVAGVACIFIGVLLVRLGVFTLAMVKDVALLGAALSLVAMGAGVLSLDGLVRRLLDALRKRPASPLAVRGGEARSRS